MDQGGQAIVDAELKRAAYWPKVKCYETVGAMQIVRISDVSTDYPVMHMSDGTDVRATDGMFNHYRPVPGDWLIYWEEGGLSIIPKAVFDRGFVVA